MTISKFSNKSILSNLPKYKSMYVNNPSLLQSTRNIFNDGSCLALWQFDGNANDNGGVYNGTPTNLNYTTADKIAGTHSAVFRGDTNVAIPSVKDTYPFAISLWATHNGGWSPPSGQQHEFFNLSIGGQRVSLGCTSNPGWTDGITLMYGGTNHWSVSNSVFNGNATDFFHIVFNVVGSNNSSHQIFVNGVSQSMVNNGGGHGGTAGWSIGSNGQGGEFWPGLLDNVRFFNRVLTQSEVTSLYEARA
jgi:hypothetical protein